MRSSLKSNGIIEILPDDTLDVAEGDSIPSLGKHAQALYLSAVYAAALQSFNHLHNLQRKIPPTQASILRSFMFQMNFEDKRK